MKYKVRIASFCVSLGMVGLAMSGNYQPAVSAASTCYKASDPSFFSIIGVTSQPTTTGSSAAIINGEQGTDFIGSSTVDDAGSGNRPFHTAELFFHTLGNSKIAHSKECDWTRWYQTEGKIQGFRLFATEVDRSGGPNISPRVEAHTTITGWNGLQSVGTTYSWSGRYQILNPEEASLFQLKQSSDNDWAVMLRLGGDGNVYILPRNGTPVLVGKPGSTPFGVRVSDKRGSSSSTLSEWSMAVEIAGKTPVVVKGTKNWGNFPNNKNQFRWGIYHDGITIIRDAAGALRIQGGSSRKTPSIGSRLLVAGAQWGTA